MQPPWEGEPSFDPTAPVGGVISLRFIWADGSPRDEPTAGRGHSRRAVERRKARSKVWNIELKGKEFEAKKRPKAADEKKAFDRQWMRDFCKSQEQ